MESTVLHPHAHSQPATTAPPGRVLQRACACGGTPGPTGECAECRRKRLLQPKLTVNQPGDRYEQEADRVAEAVMRMPETAGARAASPGARRIEVGPARQAEALPTVPEVLREPGRALDAHTRGFMETRFGYDFSRVRVHTDRQAAASARMLSARAYTVGRDVVFGAGTYAPETQAGKKLLAHELTHVVQAGGHEREASPSPVVRRQSVDEPLDVGEEIGWEFEVIAYGTYLDTYRDIEGMPTSGMKALALARRRLKGEQLALPPNGDALLIIELLNIDPDAEQRRAALALLEQMNTAVLLTMITRKPTDTPGQIGLWELAGKFQGDELMRVLDFFSRRFKGDFTGLLRGQGPLKATENTTLEQRTLDWLTTHKRSAQQYFDSVWRTHRVVLLGETHHKGPQQRRFAADMIRRHGGPSVTLALETKHQAPIDAYLENKDKSTLPPWFEPGEYTRLLDAARASGTLVNAVDLPLPSLDPKRDMNMAAAIEVEEELGNKVLFYGGAMHIREVRAHHKGPLGRLLSGTYGAGSYAINMEFTDTLTNPFFSMLKQRFPTLPSIGFDVDKSPLRWRADPDVQARTDLGENVDGYIYFLQ